MNVPVHAKHLSSKGTNLGREMDSLFQNFKTGAGFFETFSRTGNGFIAQSYMGLVHKLTWTDPKYSKNPTLLLPNVASYTNFMPSN